MSQWNHPMCDECFFREVPGRDPVRIHVAYRERERCCWCGKDTFSGIYRREEPAKLPLHKEHDT